MEFGILGLLEVSDDGQMVDVQPAKLRALLAMLVLNANEVVSSERLVEALWVDAPPASAANTLQGYVSRLRKMLTPGLRGPGAGPLQTRPPGYVLAVAADQVDAKRFERLAAEGRRALARSDAAEAGRILAEALSLWRGPALADFTYHQFAQEAIRRLEELRLSAVEDRVDAELAVGHHIEVLGELKALTAATPLRERRWAQLMLALYRSGHQADALRAYRALRRLLTEELGIVPSGELQRLEQAILVQDPMIEWTASQSSRPVAAADADPSSPPIRRGCEVPIPLPRLLRQSDLLPMVGRRSETSQLLVAWQEALGWSRQAVFVAGEPGVGKTRLAADLGRQLQAQGNVVLAGRCDDGMAVPYQPFVEALRHLVDNCCQCHLGERLGRWPGELIRLVPEIAERLPTLAAPVSTDPDTGRYRLFDAVASWLATTSSRHPVLVLLDDLQWATKPTLLLLRHVLRSSQPMRLLIMATYRDTELLGAHPLAELLADLGPAPDLGRLNLHGLDVGGVDELLALATGGKRPGHLPPWAPAVYADTKGNPFFVAEVGRYLVDIDVFDQAPAMGSILNFGLPEGVLAVVSRRLSRLQKETLSVLAVAAVSGLEFDPLALQVASGLDEETLVSGLEEAVAARLVEEIPGPGQQFRFSHALVRASMYDQTAQVRRKLLHRRVGEAIESIHDRHLADWLPELAHHFGQAAGGGFDVKAASYAELAGDRAMAQLAYDEAVTYYRQALAFADPEDVDDGGPGRQCDLLISLGEAQRRAGDRGYHRSLLDAAQSARRLNDPDRLAKAALANHRGMWSGAGGVDGELVEVLRAAVEAYPSQDSAVRARLLAHLSVELVYSGDWDTRVWLSEQAVAMARRVGDLETLVLVLSLRILTLWAAPGLADRVATTSELQVLAAQLNDPTPTFYAAFLGGYSIMEAGDMETADRLLGLAHHLAEDLHQPILRWYDLRARAKRAIIAGELDRGERLALEAFTLGQSLDQPDAARIFGAQIFTVRLHQGRLGELVGMAESGFAPFTDTGSLGILAQMGLAAVYCEVGRPDDAGTVFELAMAGGLRGLPQDSGSLPTVAVASFVCSALDDDTRAPELYELLAPYRSQFIDVGATWLGSTAHYLALMAATSGDYQAADAHFAYAASQHQRTSPVWLAWTEFEWGRMLARSGRGDDRGRGLLGQALGRARSLGLAAIEQRSRDLLDRSVSPPIGA